MTAEDDTGRADPHEQTAPAPRPGRTRAVLAAVAVVAYAADQVTKHLAVERLAGRDDVPLVGRLLQLRFATNPGAAFSTGMAFTEALSVFALVAALAVLWVARRVGSVGWAVSLGLLLAGITGNLTDRLLRPPGPFRGEVVDFLMLPNWPIFNVADVCINVGAALLLVLAWRGVRLDGTRVESEHRPGAGDPTDAEGGEGGDPAETRSAAEPDPGTGPDEDPTPRGTAS